jgi:integrase
VRSGASYWATRDFPQDRRLARVEELDRPVFGPPKTDASLRTIPLPQVVVDGLAHHLAHHATGEQGLVLTIDGRTITRSLWGHLWRPIAREVGLPAGTGPHSLRHYYASLLIRHGESIKTVQARLGHATAAETLDTYSHVWPDSDDRTREAIDAVLGPGFRDGRCATSSTTGGAADFRQIRRPSRRSRRSEGWCGRAGL